MDLERLSAARRSLRANLDRSLAISSALVGSTPPLAYIRARLPFPEAFVRPICAPPRREALASVGPHIDRAVGPAAAVLKVLDAVHGLELSLLSDPGRDLPSSLSLLKRLKEVPC